MAKKKKAPPIRKISRQRSRKKAIVHTTLCAKDGDLGLLVNQMRSLMRAAGIQKLAMWGDTQDVTLVGMQ